MVGATAAVPTVGLGLYLARNRALDLLALQFAAIAAVYVGASLTKGQISVIWIETVAVVVFLLLALFGRWASPALLALGYFVHGLWDAVHHWGVIPGFLPDWYGPFCLGYDWALAVFVGLTFVRSNPARL